MKELPLYKQIQHQLKELILSGKLRPGDRIPSENELAEYFNVSQITSKQAIMALVDENIIIRIKGKGSFVAGRNGTDILQSLNSGFKGIIGLVFPSIYMTVESMMFYHLQSMLHEKGYQTLIRVTDDNINKEMEAIRMFQLFGVRGFIIFPVINENYNDEILRLSLNRFPHVLIDRYLPNITNSSITSDNVMGARDVVRYLLDSGHKCISFISQSDTNSVTHDRIIGFEKAFTEKDLPIDKRYWLFVKRDNRSNKEQDLAVKTKLHEYFERHPGVTAILAVDTIIARLAYAVLSEMGKAIPKDIVLVSFDDPKLPFVPFVQQDMIEIAKRSVGLLISQMEDEYKFRRELVPMQFVSDVQYPLSSSI